MHTHTYTDMPTRTISITDEAYHRLALLKDDRDSFSDIILKMTGKVNLLDFAGVLTKGESSKLRDRIRESREASKTRLHAMRARLEK